MGIDHIRVLGLKGPGHLQADSRRVSLNEERLPRVGRGGPVHDLDEKGGVQLDILPLGPEPLVDFLQECGIENPIVCSSINKAGYLMCPNIEAYERTLRRGNLRPMAMSILASRAVPPQEAVEYVTGFPHIRSIVFGASSIAHIQQTKEMIDANWQGAAVQLRKA